MPVESRVEEVVGSHSELGEESFFGAGKGLEEGAFGAGGGRWALVVLAVYSRA